jgi:hypothetical protein
MAREFCSAIPSQRLAQSGWKLSHCLDESDHDRLGALLREFDEHDEPSREVDEKIWLVSFLDFDLGYFDEKEGRVEPGPNPFETKC